MTTIQQLYGLQAVTPHKPAGLSTIQPKSIIKSQEMVGIEVEIENVRLENNPNRIWGVTEDGSLRNNGRELITRPIMAEHAPLALTYLFDGYLPKNWCFSPRTSVHVHLNMLDVSYEQVVNFVMLYSIYEQAFYRFAGRGRNKNIYCVPLSDTDLLTNLSSGQPIGGDGWSKYTGLNLLPLMNQGTVEFRHMHGTADVEKLSTWIGLICKLKEYIKATKVKDIRSEIINMTDDYNFGRLTDMIFHDLSPNLRIQSVADVSYLSAKQVLSSNQNAAVIRGQLSPSAPFFTFKGI